MQRRQTGAIERRADGQLLCANHNDGEGWGVVYAPFAIGSHRSCSLTSNSYPSPCACVSSAFLSICWSSSGDCGGSTPSFFGGVDDMFIRLTAGAVSGFEGACALADCSVICWRPRHWETAAKPCNDVRAGERCG